MKKITHNTIAILQDKALQLGATTEVTAENLLKVSFGDHVDYFDDALSSKTTAIAYTVCKNKDYSKQFLLKAGLSVPKGEAYRQDEYDNALSYVKSELSWPVVIKPAKGLGGDLVFARISNETEFQTAWDEIFAKYDIAIVEERFEGEEYRIFSTTRQAYSVIKRIPANVIGDGEKNIKELIDIKNTDPKRAGAVTPLRKIKIDSTLKLCLEKQGLSLESVLPDQQLVYLRENSNISTGGESIECTENAHPSILEIARKAVDSIPGLPYAGVDIMIHDISAEQSENTYKIIEINSSPGLSLHHEPSVGESCDIATEILKIVFPEITKKD